MSERPFMQLYVSDFIGDTLHLSTEQIGAYMLILMAMWNAGGQLADDDAKLARIVRMSVKKWRAIADDLMPFFERSSGLIVHNRLTKELQKSEGKSQSRAAAGAKGGAAKALKDNEARSAIAIAGLQHSPDTITRIEKEKPPVSPKSGTRWQKGQAVPEPWLQWGREHFPSVDPAKVAGQARQFADYWPAKAGREGVKLDWEATWRNWLRKAFPGAEIEQGMFSTDLVSLGPDDPDFQLVERYRGKPFLLGNSGKATVKRSEIELARKAAA